MRGTQREKPLPCSDSCPPGRASRLTSAELALRASPVSAVYGPCTKGPGESRLRSLSRAPLLLRAGQAQVSGTLGRFLPPASVSLSVQWEQGEALSKGCSLRDGKLMPCGLLRGQVISQGPCSPPGPHTQQHILPPNPRPNSVPQRFSLNVNLEAPEPGGAPVILSMAGPQQYRLVRPQVQRSGLSTAWKDAHRQTEGR